MSDHTADDSRRRFIKLTAIGLAAAPFANVLSSGAARAAELEMLDESDPMAVALKYKADATESERQDDTHLCSNCNLYTSTDEEAGPCTLFPGKLVAADGWCVAWVKKA
ncbi:MAG: twin-arginine translocation signal domain-containing protein [Candidatus Competibacteraceae bacterium]|nr:MAG: twin-arginine translocation signal domain-containing protein [Candidatus Competibacteraceae bacterium]